MQFRFTHFAGALAVAIVAIVVAIVSIKSAVQHRIAMQTAQTAFGREKLNILILGYQEGLTIGAVATIVLFGFLISGAWLLMIGSDEDQDTPGV